MEQDKQEAANGGNDSPERKGWGRWIATGAVAALALGGIGIAAAMSNDVGGHRMGGFGGHMRHMAMGGEHGLENMLDRIDATPEQEKKLWAIIDAARAEIRPVVRELRGTRDEVAEIIGAPTIDRAAVEKLRSERIATLDKASKKVTTALLDAADVLTPEQREKLLEHFKERQTHDRW
ncbi:Spy/CpxP family protein refolding chaperone [Mesorhizobium sp.]|uniref:Spy/CpxP family protein refolding chaperone n=1 Tax=Mesorhizobium sp. TaxID=1871066 RepID=UPI000FE64146|nr:Spy/CpxP family protein refolding chaperone [Mesorhizobium sp.]RWB25765.1 MAG: periplasmic heavy metal sensor [Mesorhizobium sp.]